MYIPPAQKKCANYRKENTIMQWRVEKREISRLEINGWVCVCVCVCVDIKFFFTVGGVFFYFISLVMIGFGFFLSCQGKKKKKNGFGGIGGGGGRWEDSSRRRGHFLCNDYARLQKKGETNDLGRLDR